MSPLRFKCVSDKKALNFLPPRSGHYVSDVTVNTSMHALTFQRHNVTSAYAPKSKQQLRAAKLRTSCCNSTCTSSLSILFEYMSTAFLAKSLIYL